MTIIRGLIPRSLVPGIHEFVGLSYGAVEEEHKPLFDILTSKRAFEEEVMLSGMGGAPTKAEGAAVTFDDIQETYTSRYTMETIAIGFSVTKEAFDDDLYGNIARAKSTELGRAMADTKQSKAAAIFNRGFNTSYKGGDGVPLFSASHPLVGGGTASNTAAVDISESAIEDMLVSINLMTNDRGILISARPVSLHIPAQSEYIATKILKAEYSSAPVRNQANTDNVGGILLQPNLVSTKFPGGIHVNRRFTDNDCWFIKTSVTNGAKMFVREALNGSNNTDFGTDNALFKFRERYAFGWTDWRGYVGSQGA